MDFLVVQGGVGHQNHFNTWPVGVEQIDEWLVRGEGAAFDMKLFGSHGR